MIKRSKDKTYVLSQFYDLYGPEGLNGLLHDNDDAWKLCDDIFDDYERQILAAETERDQLKARVMELEQLADNCNRHIIDNGVDGRHYRDHFDKHRYSTPAQSLEAHDREVVAKALEEFSEGIDSEDGPRYPGPLYHELLEAAEQIRAGGEK